MTSILEALTAHPQNKRILAEKMGWSTREVELEINRYRLAGIPILSDQDGYWIAQTADEVRGCADRLRRRAVNQLLTSRALRRAAKRMAAKEAAPLSFPWQDAA